MYEAGANMEETPDMIAPPKSRTNIPYGPVKIDTRTRRKNEQKHPITPIPPNSAINNPPMKLKTNSVFIKNLDLVITVTSCLFFYIIAVRQAVGKVSEVTIAVTNVTVSEY